MRCAKAKILISASLDGELSRREELALERHLAACRACADEQVEFGLLRETMSHWEDEEPSAWLAESFGYRLEQIQRRKSGRIQRKPRTRVQWGVFGRTASLVAVGLLAVGFYLHNYTRPVDVRPGTNPPVVAQQHSQQKPVVEPEVKDNVATAVDTAASVVKLDQSVQPVERAQVKPRRNGVTVAAVPVQRHPSAVPAAVRPTARDYARPADNSTAPAPPHESRPTVVASNPGPVPGSESPVEGLAIAEAAQGAVTIKVTGELARHETVERVRGNLQRMADLLVSARPTPAGNSMNSDGGETL